MKKYIIILFLLIGCVLSSCTQQARVKAFGGTQTVNLPKGKTVIMATWKNNDNIYMIDKIKYKDSLQREFVFNLPKEYKDPPKDSIFN